VATPAANALAPMSGGAVLRTLAQGKIGCNKEMILLWLVLGCVINGDTLSGVLRQATWLVVAVIVMTTLDIAQGLISAPKCVIQRKVSDIKS
jgi:hypothetical protein